MKSLRIVFMGTPEFAIPSLERIHHSEHRIVGVVTQPDRPRARGKQVLPTPVKAYALSNNLSPILQPEKMKNPEFIDALKKLDADLFVVVAFRILPEAVFTIPPKGTINLHPSLLPKYRGAAPINWTVINGDSETAVTTIFIQKEIDAGNIILQKKLPVFPDDTAGTLHDRLAVEGADLLLETINLIAAGEVRTSPQDASLASPAPKLTKEICHLNFHQPASRVRQWIHGLSPYPGAYAFWGKTMTKFFLAEVVNERPHGFKPGEVVRAEGEHLWIACQPGIIAIKALQFPGKKRMSPEEYLRGNDIPVGTLFQ